MRKPLLSLGVFCLTFLLAFPGLGSDSKSAGETSYLIETSHTPEECLRSLDAVVDETPKLLDKMQWGCGADVHKGWMFVTADDEAAARNMLPSSLREDANIVPIGKFTADQIRSYHNKKK